MKSQLRMLPGMVRDLDDLIEQVYLVAAAGDSWEGLLRQIATSLRAKSGHLVIRRSAQVQRHHIAPTGKDGQPDDHDLMLRFVRAHTRRVEIEVQCVPRRGSQLLLEEIARHIERVVQLEERLKTNRGRDEEVVSALADAMGLGLCVVHKTSRRLLHVNKRALGIGKQTALLVGDADTTRMGDELRRVFGYGLAMLARSNNTKVVQRVPWARERAGAWVAMMLVELARFSPDIRDVDVDDYVVVVLAAPQDLSGAQANYLRTRYGLSPKETRLAIGLAQGDSLDCLATRFNVSRNTLRAQLRGLLQKTGATSQAALVGQMLDDPRLIFAPPEPLPRNTPNERY